MNFSIRFCPKVVSRSIVMSLNARDHVFLVFCLYGLLLQSASVIAENIAYRRLDAFSSASADQRQLRAASSAVDLGKRDSRIPLQYDLTLDYFEDVSMTTGDPFSAHVNLGSKLPVLVLEDIEHLVESVHCDLQSIEIVFNSKQHLMIAQDALFSHPRFILITSHWSCNEEGSRLPYLIYDSFFNEHKMAVDFMAEKIGWSDSFHSMKVDFGCKENSNYRLLPHRNLQRRSFVSSLVNELDGAASSTATVSLSSVLVSSTTILTPTTSIAFPTIASTVQATATSIVQNVNFTFINSQILPSNNSAIADIEGVEIPAGLSVACINCTATGSVELSTGSFTMGGTKSTSNNTDDVFQFIEHGYAEVVVDNLFTHIELGTSWLAAQVGKSFTINLASIGLTPISIPDIAVVGPAFNPRLIVGVDVGLDLDFSYGFELTVPNNSTALANIGNVSSSQLTGFENTSLNILPFQSKFGNLALNLSVTFQPEILIGFSFADDIGNAGAGIFLELPQLSVEIAPAVGTNDKCEPITNVTLVNDILQLFGNLTHIVPDVELAGGFIAQATLGPHSVNANYQTAYTPLATTFPLPTACLAFDSKASTYGPASMMTTTTATAPGSATSTGAANTLYTPALKKESDHYGVQIALALLLMVCGSLLIF